MKFSSVKHALGWYVARRKGPAKLRAWNPGDRLTKTPLADNTHVQIAIAKLLHSPPPKGLGLHRHGKPMEKLLEWASTADEAQIDVDLELVEQLADLLEGTGLLNRVRPPEGDYVEFVDLNTGQVMRTWRENR